MRTKVPFCPLVCSLNPHNCLHFPPKSLSLASKSIDLFQSLKSNSQWTLQSLLRGKHHSCARFCCYNKNWGAKGECLGRISPLIMEVVNLARLILNALDEFVSNKIEKLWLLRHNKWLIIKFANKLRMIKLWQNNLEFWVCVLERKLISVGEFVLWLIHLICCWFGLCSSGVLNLFIVGIC